MEVIGQIKVINETQQVSDSFKKRELVVTTSEQYPQDILIEFTQDKCDVLNSYKVGDSVSVSINLRGREWVNPQGEKRYFNSIQGWKIEKVDQTKANETQVKEPQSVGSNNEPYDLPF